MNESIFDKFPEIETERLMLKEIFEEDAHIIFKGNSTLSALKYIARDPFNKIEDGEKKVADYKKWFSEKTCVMFKLCLKNNNHPVGYGGIFNISLSANKGEIGYIILEEFWGKGFASEAVSRIIKFGFEDLKLNKIFALIDPSNTASKKVVEKHAFEIEGLHKQNDFAQGKYFDVLYYALFIDKWASKDDNK